MSRTVVSTRTALGFILLAAGWTSLADAAIVKVNDRKFPIGNFCPIESRAAAGADLTFVAGGSAARITFAAANLKGTCSSSGAPCLLDAECPATESCDFFCSESFTSCAVDGDCPTGEGCGTWNGLRLDNVTVLPKSMFDANLLAPSPFYEDCYFTAVPPGHTTGGTPGAPSYDHVGGGSEAYVELFDNAAAAGTWSGDTYFEASRTAPRNPAGPDFADLDESGGSLGIGIAADGRRTVSASLLVTGLTPGQQYVVFGWWSIQVADTMTLTIEENACIDEDGDGFVDCSGCIAGPGETCGDCDDSNPHCGESCEDVDLDGYCPPSDCDDTTADCDEDCTTDLDGDGVPYCRDTCVDPDGDGFGTAGGAGQTCSGTDCLEGNALCNVSCVDGDGDGACPPADCDDNDPLRYPASAEINDCADQQCPGEPGYGITDETSGNSGFLEPDKQRYAWPAQQGATQYQALRADSPDFSTGCVYFTTMSTLWVDSTTPAPGEILFYLNRPTAPCAGSWGQDSASVERTVCMEMCTNGLDDDGDGLIDCADPDCASDAACQITVQFSFVDGPGDDIDTLAFHDFLQPLVVGAGDYFYFEIDEQGWNRNVAWCAENAAFYRTAYLNFALSSGSVFSGTWNRWYRAPATANNWSGPFVSPLLNEFGNDSFGVGAWCSEQFSLGPRNCLFPDRVNDCEAYDLATGACAVSIGLPWTVTIRIAPTRLAACGF